ncbi:MAG: class I SAM-dependent DNA methyltransferase [Sedimentisphaerales bacterium]
MKKEYTYRDSHKYPGKGTEYEAYYETQPWQRFLWSREREIILRILEKYFAGKDIHLLDFACGTGRITSFLEERVKTSTGVDVSSSMLAIAQKKLKRTEIIKADITTNDVLKGRKFNLIMAFRFFVNAEPALRSAAIEALAKLLSEDGYFVFNNHQSLGSPWIKLLYMRHQQKNPHGIFNVMTLNEMEKLVEGVGMEIVELYPVGFFHPPKIPVPQILTVAIENVCCKFKSLARFSESPIAVCRKLKTQNY